MVRFRWRMAVAILVVATVLSVALALLWPVWTSQAQPAGTIVRHGPTHAKEVAFTFDDGPTLGTPGGGRGTAQILDVLETYHTKATFFVLGQFVLAHPDLVHRELRLGAEVENHGYNHTFMTRMSPAAIRSDILRGAGAIKQITGRQPRFLRPPGGPDGTNAQVEAAARSLGLPIVFWTIDTRDWSRPGVGFIVNRVEANIQPGAIVLFHDLADSRQTAAALGQLIPWLGRHGYRLVTLSELLGG